jgi:hypothetical protein
MKCGMHQGPEQNANANAWQAKRRIKKYRAEDYADIVEDW